MNINYIRENFQFNLRTSAIIYSKDLTKILLFNVVGRDFYLLPGGRVNELEKSSDAIKREIKEELDFNINNFKFVTISEEFVNAKGYNNHQINIIYECIYENDIKEIEFNGLEGNWIKFKWIDIKDIDNYIIYPKEIIDIINKKYKQLK